MAPMFSKCYILDAYQVVCYDDFKAEPLILGGLLILSNCLESALYYSKAYCSSGAVNKIPAVPEFARPFNSCGRYQLWNTTAIVLAY